MKEITCVLLLVILALVTAYPQKEGNAYTNEAIRQAQQSYLIPKDAQIQKVRFLFLFLLFNLFFIFKNFL